MSDTESEVVQHLRRIEQAVKQDGLHKLVEDIMEEQGRLWRDHAALRDELHSTVTALSNRIESATRTPFDTGGDNADA